MLPPARVTLGRRRTASCLRTAVFIFIVTFLWLQLHMAGMSGSGGKHFLASSTDQASEQAATAQILALVPTHLHKFLLPLPGRNGTNSSIESPVLNITAVKRSIEKQNAQQVVYNEEKFGALHNDSLVIVVQVHTRLLYLRHLIVSLAQARGIEETLLVISHDHFDPEINELVKIIDFCKVTQIFYPFSIQTHPHEFPGESPNDCPRNAKREQAVKSKCINAEHPDVYGHYREAKFTQTKHHWWWKANRVFDQLEVTRNHSGLVLFLEEDHYVAEDFIHVLHVMQKAVHANCQQCNMFSLGTYLKTYNYYADPKAAEVTPWVSSKHNMGMAFNRSVWREMRGCSNFFCTYDDYNWDWSLQHVSQGCMTHKLHAVVMRGPRVFHIGECGVHHRKNNCESMAAITKVHQVLKHAHKHLFPSHLTLTFPANPKKQKLRKGNGGWGDVRDHHLCLNMTAADFRLR